MKIVNCARLLHEFSRLLRLYDWLNQINVFKGGQIMKRFCLMLLCLLALMLAVPALADPVLTSTTGYTAYLGENNYLYLKDPENVTKVLQTPIADLNAITDTVLYCTTADGRLFEVQLDGSSSKLATQDALDALTADPAENPLAALSSTIVAAASAPDAIYYVTDNGMGGYALMTIALPVAEGTAPTGTVALSQVNKPISMSVTPDAITLVNEEGLVDVYSRLTLEHVQVSKPNAGLTNAFAFDNKLVLLSANEAGQFTVLETQQLLIVPTLVPAVTATAEPTATPTAAPTATVKPTAKPTTKPTTSSSDNDGRIYKGDSGSAVRKMQRRLLELGYPVGKVDGAFGDETLLAVNLFQCAIDYRNHTYASKSMLNKLYDKSAPVYDPYAPLKEGDKGADVRLMQEALIELGYDVGKKGADGAYGEDTKAAVTQFQTIANLYGAKLEVTGEADADTLKLLLDEENPIPNATPVPDPATQTDL